MPKTKDLTAPDLLYLVSLDFLPEMSAVLADRDALSTALEAIEAEALATRQYLSLCANSPENPLFETLMADGRARLKELEARQVKLRNEAVVLDEAVNAARAQTRSATLPAIRGIALPEIDAKIRTLEVIAMVQRLLGKTTIHGRTVQQQHVEELEYLKRLRDLVLCEEQ